MLLSQIAEWGSRQFRTRVEEPDLNSQLNQIAGAPGELGHRPSEKELHRNVGVPRFRGVMSPVLTPFNDDLTPSPSRFVKHCRWLLKQAVGLAISGPIPRRTHFP